MDTLHIAVCDNHVSSLTFITSEITKQIMNMNVQADVASFSSGEDCRRMRQGIYFLPAKMSCAVYRRECFLTCTF